MPGLVLLLGGYHVVLHLGSHPSAHFRHDFLGRQGHCCSVTTGKISAERGGKPVKPCCGVKQDEAPRADFSLDVVALVLGLNRR